MIRRIKALYNEIENKWLFNVDVKIITKETKATYGDTTLIGSVEYNNGIWLDVFYDVNDGLLGVEFNEKG